MKTSEMKKTAKKINFTDGEIKHAAKRNGTKSDKLSKAERKKIKSIRKFKRNNDL